MKEAVQEGTILEKEIAEVFVNSEDAVAVRDIHKFERHTQGAVHGVFIAARRTEAAVAAEGDKLQFSAMGTSIHSSAKSGIAAVDHFFNIFHLRLPGMEGILDYFIIVSKYFLQDIHSTIMRDTRAKRNPSPQD